MRRAFANYGNFATAKNFGLLARRRRDRIGIRDRIRAGR
jgi:hypothetical protein